MSSRTSLRPIAALLALPLLALLPACRTLPFGARDHRIVDTRTGTAIELDELADRLAAADVVFLGELHDDDRAHELQLAMTEALLQRHGRLAVSLEMFERDVQHLVDDYLAGRIDEARFLAESRPWKNYREHYRPVVELARREELPVLAANVPRPLARRVAYEGPAAVLGEPDMPVETFRLPDGYERRFAEAMGVHEGEEPDDPERLANWYAAQCVKDDAMAESIADYLASAAPAAPPVVHWCGRFHSDYRLGTVARLALRRPDLRIAVVTTVRTDRPSRELTADERALADFVWLVPE